MKNKKIDETNILLVNLQIISTLASFVALIMYLFQRKMFQILCICLSLNLFVLAFNNYKIFKKKNYTMVYIIAGIVLLVYTILQMMGVSLWTK